MTRYSYGIVVKTLRIKYKRKTGHISETVRDRAKVTINH